MMMMMMMDVWMDVSIKKLNSQTVTTFDNISIMYIKKYTNFRTGSWTESEQSFLHCLTFPPTKCSFNCVELFPCLKEQMKTVLVKIWTTWWGVNSSSVHWGLNREEVDVSKVSQDETVGIPGVTTWWSDANRPHLDVCLMSSGRGTCVDPRDNMGTYCSCSANSHWPRWCHHLQTLKPLISGDKVSVYGGQKKPQNSEHKAGDRPGVPLSVSTWSMKIFRTIQQEGLWSFWRLIQLTTAQLQSLSLSVALSLPLSLFRSSLVKL